MGLCTLNNCIFSGSLVYLKSLYKFTSLLPQFYGSHCMGREGEGVKRDEEGLGRGQGDINELDENGGGGGWRYKLIQD